MGHSWPHHGVRAPEVGPIHEQCDVFLGGADPSLGGDQGRLQAFTCKRAVRVFEPCGACVFCAHRYDRVTGAPVSSDEL